MRDVRRPDAFEPLVERLTTPKLTETGVPVFQTIMDLLIFCSALGFAVQRRIPVPSSGKAVPFRIFENNQKDGYIFLVALAEKKQPSALATENDDETVRTFEEYAAGGLDELSAWLAENPADISGVQTLITKIQAKIPISPLTVENPAAL